jgi:hypothetical protein
MHKDNYIEAISMSSTEKISPQVLLPLPRRTAISILLRKSCNKKQKKLNAVKPIC